MPSLAALGSLALLHLLVPAPPGLEVPATETAEQESSAKVDPKKDDQASADSPEGDNSKTPERDEHQEPGRLASPDQVGNRIELDAVQQMAGSRFGFLRPYVDWKKRLYERTGFGFGADYTASVWGSRQTSGPVAAAGAIARLYLNWDAVDRGGDYPGGLVVKGEHRHRYAQLAPQAFASSLDYAGLLAPPFNDGGFLLTNLYWNQGFLKRRLVLLLGYLDATDYVDLYGLVSPWLHFSNFAFSTGSASMSPPNQGLGAAFGAWILPQLYVLASMNDLNADPTRPHETFVSFFTEGKLFKSVEVGYTSKRERAYVDNIHVTGWHASSSLDGSAPPGWGITASAAYMFADQVLPFVRGGYSDGASTVLQGSVSAGVGWQWIPHQDLLAFAFNWGRPNPETYGERLRDQYTLELMYRLQIADQLALTPDVQLLIQPALSQEYDVAGVFGLRARLAL